MFVELHARVRHITSEYRGPSSAPTGLTLPRRGHYTTARVCKRCRREGGADVHARARTRASLVWTERSLRFKEPRACLRAQWEHVRRDDRPFDHLARYFKVSAIVAARRSLDLGLINRDTFFTFYRDHIATVRQRAEDTEGGGDFYLNQNVRFGRRFAVAVVQAVQEGRLAHRDAYTLTGLWGQTFENYVAELRGQRRRRRE